MAEGLRRKPLEQGTTPETSNPDKMNSNQSPNQGGNLNEGEITTGRPPQVEGGDGSGLTEAELMEQELSPVWSELRRLRREFGNCIIWAAGEYLKLPEYLKLQDRKGWYSGRFLEERLTNLRRFLDTVSTNTEGTKGTEGLGKMIDIAFEHNVKRFGHKELADCVVKIARELEQAVDKIANTQFSYETKADFLNELIPLMVDLILSVGPNDSESRGRKPKISNFDHPNNALLRVLDSAAYALVDQAAKSGHQELIGAISNLLEMTRILRRSDELESIHAKILVQIFVMIRESVMKNRNIDDNLIEKLKDWYANHFYKSIDRTNQINQSVRKLLDLNPSDLKLLETLTQRLNDRAHETGDTHYLTLATYLNKCFSNPNKELEEKNAKFVELRRNNTGLERMVQMVQRLLNQTGTDEEK